MQTETTKPRQPRKQKRDTDTAPLACLAIVLALLMPTAALAQSRTFYGSDGKVTGRSTTGSDGSTSFYDASGRNAGRSTTDSQGTTTLYDASGRRTGTITKSQAGR